MQTFLRGMGGVTPTTPRPICNGASRRTQANIRGPVGAAADARRLLARLCERELEFARECHAVSRENYIAIVSALPDGRLPIVRQYRPALEGLGIACRAHRSRRGCGPRSAVKSSWRRRVLPPAIVDELGCYAPCTARLSNRVHSFDATYRCPPNSGTRYGDSHKYE
jgi:hypothetical protein